MREYIGMICQGCGGRLKEYDKVVVCKECGTPQHFPCYVRQCRCAIPGCRGSMGPTVELRDLYKDSDSVIEQPVSVTENTKEPQQATENQMSPAQYMAQETEKKARKNAEALQKFEEENKKKRSKNLIIAAIVGGAALVVAALLIYIYAIPRWENAMDDYIAVYVDCDDDSLMDLAPEEYWEDKLYNTSLTVEDVEENADVYAREIHYNMYNIYGYDFTYNYEVVEEIAWSDSECRLMEDLLVGNYEIDAGYTVILNESIYGYSKTTNRDNQMYQFVKIDGQYYMVVETARGYNFVADSLIMSSESFYQDYAENFYY